MAVADLLRLLDANPVYRNRVVHIQTTEPAPPRFGTLTESLPEPLDAYLHASGIQLYTHQCEAINRIRAGASVIITTPTASGKTLAFNLPVFECIRADPDARALYLYPTKALANDQYATLDRMAKFSGIAAKPAIYDGDTPQSKRAAIREHARIVISNPHELHQVLSWHAKWSPFFSHLRYVIIDEAHRYRGIFGSNVALLIRRFLRISRHYGADPQFILSTATLQNPGTFAQRLTGKPCEVIDEDGSPHGTKHFVLYNPFYDGIGERSTHEETKDLLVSCVKADLQTLCFTGSRKMAELVTVWAREDAKRSSARLANSIAAYRAGYLPEERRLLERELKDGVKKAIVSTNALELGIDIGSLDAVIISGYPGTMQSTRQQAGRAGRKGAEALAILVAHANPLDQYFMHHPDQFFMRSHEQAIIDTENPYIVSGHMLCAAAELPLRTSADPGVDRDTNPGANPSADQRSDQRSDQEFFGATFAPLLADLSANGLIRETARGWVYAGRGRATEAVRLDGMAAGSYRIVCHGRLIETMNQVQAFREAHTGAIMLHQGETYVVNEMDLETHTIRVAETDVDYYTQPLKDVHLAVERTLAHRTVNGVACAYGEVVVTERYTGYKIKQKDRVIGVEPLSLPPIVFPTTAFWFTVPPTTEVAVKGVGLDLAGGLHGAEHTIIAMMPLHVMCDRWDVGGLSSAAFGDEARPMVFVYDGYEGGIGLVESAFGHLSGIFSSAFELVDACPCDDGCPTCIHSPKCGNDNAPLDKAATKIILEALCRGAGEGTTDREPT
ncbi:MAG: DEAD/DEAH box helicase [Methanoregula sp.]